MCVFCVFKVFKSVFLGIVYVFFMFYFVCVCALFVLKKVFFVAFGGQNRLQGPFRG